MQITASEILQQLLLGGLGNCAY